MFWNWIALKLNIEKHEGAEAKKYESKREIKKNRQDAESQVEERNIMCGGGVRILKWKL